MYPSFRIAVLAVMVSRALAVPIPISSSSAADITELHAPTTTTTTIVDEVPEQTYLNYPTPVEGETETHSLIYELRTLR
jgi:hypothetical protein